MPDQFEGRKLYYVKNVFLLSDGANLYEIDEPIKWGDIDIQILWDPKVMGYKFEFSDQDVLLEFDEAAGYSIIKAMYNEKFEGMNMSLHFGELDSGDNLTILFEAKLNFDSYIEGKFTIKMNCERRSFSDKLRTRFDTKTDLYSATSVENLALPSLTTRELFLHPRILTKSGAFAYNESTSVEDVSLTEEIETVGSTDFYYYTTVPPIKASVLNIEGFQEPLAPQGLLIYSGTSLGLGLKKRIFNISAGLSFKFTMPNHSNFVRAGFTIYRRSQISQGNTDLYPPVSEPANESYLISQLDFGNLAGEKFFEGSISNDLIELGPDEALFYKAWVFGGDDDLLVTGFEYTEDVEMSFSITEQTVFQGSVVDAIQIHDAVNRQLETILDVQNPLQSNFLGLISQGYEANGCASGHLVLDGLGVRGFDGRPFNMSAKDWSTALSNLFCMGMSIERDADNNESVRFEPLPYFFRNVLLFSFTVISEYERRPALEYIFNELSIGFKKYPQDNQPDSLEDWMTQMDYLSLIKTVKGKLSKIIDWILSPYYIEYTRLESLRDNPTNAYETDKDTFLFSSRLHVNPEAGVSMIFDADNHTITINKVFPIVEGDDFTISAGTGLVTNGPYRAVAANIDYAYTKTIITCGEGFVPTTGAGTGTITIAVADRYQAKRDEDFDIINNVNNEKSVYNLEHHIRRIKLRWAKYYNTGMFKEFDDPTAATLKFTSGSNNIDVATALKDEVECRYGSVLEGYQDSGPLVIATKTEQPLFRGNIITFNAPLTWETLNLIRMAFEGRHPDGLDYGYFEWPNPDGIIEKGFILDLKFKPVTQMIKVSFIEKF